MVWAWLACAPVDEAVVWPEPDALPQQDAPDPFTAFDGSTVDWDTRRPEVVALLEHYVYGPGEPVPPLDDARVELDGAVQIGPVLVFVPQGEGPFPLLLGLNKCGNHTVHPREDIPVGDGWTEATCSGERGSRADYWAIDQALDAGIAVATVHQSAFAADDRDQADEAIATWANGLCAALDALHDLPVSSVALFGHSRRGKAALWAAARDERVDVVFPHQSGTAGVALSRGSTGETVDDITSLFPHWLSPRFAEFAAQEDRLPVDQHLLVALVAPRDVLATDGDDDAWANPAGAEDSVALAQPVFDAVGGSATWRSRPGGHEVTEDDWAVWIEALAGIR